MIAQTLLILVMNGLSAHAETASGTQCVINAQIAKVEKRAHGNVLISVTDPKPETDDAICKTIDVNTMLSGMRIPNPKLKVGERIKLNLSCPTSTICGLSSILPIAAPKPPPPPPKDEKTKCLEAGGTWKTWSKSEASKKIQSCRIHATDTGQPCGDDNECSLHRCEYDPQAETGMCSEFGSTEGCHTWMKDGGPQPEVCKD